MTILVPTRSALRKDETTAAVLSELALTGILLSYLVCATKAQNSANKPSLPGYVIYMMLNIFRAVSPPFLLYSSYAENVNARSLRIFWLMLTQDASVLSIVAMNSYHIIHIDNVQFDAPNDGLLSKMSATYALISTIAVIALSTVSKFNDKKIESNIQTSTVSRAEALISPALISLAFILVLIALVKNTKLPGKLAVMENATDIIWIDCSGMDNIMDGYFIGLEYVGLTTGVLFAFSMCHFLMTLCASAIAPTWDPTSYSEPTNFLINTLVVMLLAFTAVQQHNENAHPDLYDCSGTDALYVTIYLCASLFLLNSLRGRAGVYSAHKQVNSAEGYDSMNSSGYCERMSSSIKQLFSRRGNPMFSEEQTRPLSRGEHVINNRMYSRIT